MENRITTEASRSLNQSRDVVEGLDYSCGGYIVKVLVWCHAKQGSRIAVHQVMVRPGHALFASQRGLEQVDAADRRDRGRCRWTWRLRLECCLNPAAHPSAAGGFMIRTRKSGRSRALLLTHPDPQVLTIARPVVGVADHETSPAFVGIGRQLGYVVVDFRFRRGGEHPAGAFPHDLVDQGAGLGEPSSVTTLSTGVPSGPAPQRGPTRRPYGSFGKVRPLRPSRN